MNCCRRQRLEGYYRLCAIFAPATSNQTCTTRNPSSTSCQTASIAAHRISRKAGVHTRAAKDPHARLPYDYASDRSLRGVCRFSPFTRDSEDCNSAFTSRIISGRFLVALRVASMACSLSHLAYSARVLNGGPDRRLNGPHEQFSKSAGIFLKRCPLQLARSCNSLVQQLCHCRKTAGNVCPHRAVTHSIYVLVAVATCTPRTAMADVWTTGSR